MVTSGTITPEEGLRYATSLPVVTISGINSLDILQQNLSVARGFRPLPVSGMEALRTRCEAFAADGRFEKFQNHAVLRWRCWPSAAWLPGRKDFAPVTRLRVNLLGF
jgi:hypothetical protein